MIAKKWAAISAVMAEGGVVIIAALALSAILASMALDRAMDVVPRGADAGAIGLLALLAGGVGFAWMAYFVAGIRIVEVQTVESRDDFHWDFARSAIQGRTADGKEMTFQFATLLAQRPSEGQMARIVYRPGRSVLRGIGWF